MLHYSIYSLSTSMVQQSVRQNMMPQCHPAILGVALWGYALSKFQRNLYSKHTTLSAPWDLLALSYCNSSVGSAACGPLRSARQLPHHVARGGASRWRQRSWKMSRIHHGHVTSQAPRKPTGSFSTSTIPLLKLLGFPLGIERSAHLAANASDLYQLQT